jgi:general secretion pathway protein M
MGLVLALALVWFVALQPALSTLRSAQTQGPQLRAQLQTMRQLQAQAQALQAQARAQTPESKPSDLMEAALATLGGKARLSLNGDRATVSLEGSDADALAQWLAQVRLNVRARALELHLTQSQGLWRGTIVLQLPRTSAP